MPKKTDTTSRHIKQTDSSFILVLTKEEAAKALAIGVTTFMAEVKNGRYPPAREISAGRVGWLVEDLQRAARELPVSHGLPPKNAGYGRAGKHAV